MPYLLGSVIATCTAMACGVVHGPEKHKAVDDVASSTPPSEHVDADRSSAVAGGESSPALAPELSADERALIAADPSTLSVEDRKARAYALRRKIMQNPDSPTAKALQSAAQGIADTDGKIDHGGPSADAPAHPPRTAN